MSSNASQTPSSSLSAGMLVSSRLSVRHANSSKSLQASLSSSKSRTSCGVLVEFPNNSSGNPSPSVSV